MQPNSTIRAEKTISSRVQLNTPDGKIQTRRPVRVTFALRVRVARHIRTAGDVYFFENRFGDFLGQLGFFLERSFRGVAALADEIAFIGDPRAFLLENLVLDA